ncbi:hypothetical protein DYB36_009055 [Aphanomyces astaci]|uniref:Cytochrome P450 n=2 Tax=Aphanomyces astaci TaxID=112090 RepID=A0A397A8P8_APHAT|nr:hypothetical protein DYB36_009055 [Aphanomyces astaci]
MTDLVATALGYPTVVIGVFGLVSVVGGVLVYLFTIKPALSPLNVIPGPKSTHWLFGSLKEIIDTKWSKGHFPQPALSWVKKYGGAVHYRAFLRHRVLITDPEALKHVFNTKADNYPRSTDSRLFLRVCEIIGGDGLLSSEGDAHTHMRKMLMPHFGFAKVRQFIDVFAGQTQALSAQLDRLADTNAPVDMHDLFTKLTLDIIGLSAFGYDFQSLTNQNERVMAAYKMMNQPPSILFAVGRVYLPFFDRWPLRAIQRRNDAKRMLFQTVDDVISAKLKSPRRRTGAATDLVDLMLDNQSTEHKISAEEARTHVMTFLTAGHETTSSTLCWVFSMLATHPEMETKARSECHDVAAANNGRIEWKSLGELKYVTAFIQETLRLYPTIAALATRETATDDYLPMASGKSYFVPKRFLEGSEPFTADKALRHGQGNTYYYMPFSAGAKNCIGMRFAMAELQVVVSNLLLKYSFKVTNQADLNPKQDGVSIKPVKLDMMVHRAATSFSTVDSL